MQHVLLLTLVDLFRSIHIDPVVKPVRLFDAEPDLDDRHRPDILIGNPHGFDRQVSLDVAVTSVNSQSRVDDCDPNKPHDEIYKQKLNRCRHVANQNGL